jgi:hypothetical protein
VSRPLEEWTDRRYRRDGHVAHFVPHSDSRSLCGLIDSEVLFGTGGFDEIEHANALPACELCLQEARPKTQPGSWDDLLPELIP